MKGKVVMVKQAEIDGKEILTPMYTFERYEDVLKAAVESLSIPDVIFNIMRPEDPCSPEEGQKLTALGAELQKRHERIHGKSRPKALACPLFYEKAPGKEEILSACENAYGHLDHRCLLVTVEEDLSYKILEWRSKKNLEKDSRPGGHPAKK